MRKFMIASLLAGSVLVTSVAAFMPTSGAAGSAEVTGRKASAHDLQARPKLPEEYREQRRAAEQLRAAFGLNRPDETPDEEALGWDKFSTHLRGELGLKTTPPTLSEFLARISRDDPYEVALPPARTRSRVPVAQGGLPGSTPEWGALRRLGILSERFRLLPGSVTKIDYHALNIGDAYYHVNLSTMLEMQGAVAENFASGAGFIVERLRPTADNDSAPPAFLLYTGTGPPLEFVGVESLARLAATASYADFWLGGGRPWGHLNLTFIGDGDAIDFDAAKLTMVLRLQPGPRSAKSTADYKLTFRTEEPFRPFAKTRPANLSMEDVDIKLCRGVFCVSQRVGKAIIKVYAATRSLAIEAAASVRTSLASALSAHNPRLLTDGDPRWIDHAAFDKRPREVRRKIINTAVVEARAPLDALRGQGNIEIETEIDKQKKSVRYAGLRLSPAIRIAAAGRTNALR
jgi:hypothetical protein